MSRPNVLVIMTDEERYPPPYEQEALRAFRRDQLPARERLRQRSRELHRHYVGSTACLPSRATLFTGQYPSLHGVTSTNALAKKADDPAMGFLDPNTVPTMGDWFRAGGYQTHYRGKWHISHADLVESVRRCAARDVLSPRAKNSVRGPRAKNSVRERAPASERQRANDDRLDPFGFSGWIGREPHGADPADCGLVKDPIYAEQVVGLFDELARSRSEAPWLAVASFVNPHDIVFAGTGWDLLMDDPGPDDTIPEIERPPSQADPFDNRPTAQREYVEAWPKILYEQASEPGFRRLYHYLIKVVDTAIMRILDALEASGMADDTIVVFTSDHGDLLGSHGGMV